MPSRPIFRFSALLLALPLTAAEPALRLSVYATAGDVQRYLTTPAGREKVLAALLPLRVSRIFLEGRRGDEYVPPQTLAAIRDFFTARGLQASGGIATVPGRSFGVRQNQGLTWLNFQTEKTRHDIAHFFAENAPLFEELIVDDFYCTADTSPESEQARGDRSWSQYRRDLLVSLIEPMMLEPARKARPSVRLILKYPQWYDRFHLFGYDPARMSVPFDRIWVGTEVRNPRTQRMGFVQPTEGYFNFRWLAAVAGEKVQGAWFDHIECTTQNFLDQAYQSVLAGARELTLFHLGDLIEGHPGDALLARALPELFDLAARVRNRKPAGIAFYKPPSSDAGDNMYLMDYLGMIGLPIVPEARYPAGARVVILPLQAAADPDLLEQMRCHLDTGATLILTPALLQRLVPAADLAGVRLATPSAAGVASEVEIGQRRIALRAPLEIDAALEPAGCRIRITALSASRRIPLLTSRTSGRGRLLVFNVRTFSEQDFRDSGEWLLCPKPRGLPEIPQPLADELRRAFLDPLRIRFSAPAGVALYLFDETPCFYSFIDRPAQVRLNRRPLQIPANRLLCR